MMIGSDFLWRIFGRFRSFPAHLVIEKKSNSVWMLITNGTRFSLFWSPSFNSQTFSLIVCFLWCCNNKNTRNRVKPHLKKGRKGQKRGVLGKIQFCREKKNGKIKEEKRSRKKKCHSWNLTFVCMVRIKYWSQFPKNFHLKKQMCFRFHLELKSRAE